MTVEYLQVLLATAEEVLATATSGKRYPGWHPPDGPGLCLEHRAADECRRAWPEGSGLPQWLARWINT